MASTHLRSGYDVVLDLKYAESLIALNLELANELKTTCIAFDNRTANQ